MLSGTLLFLSLLMVRKESIIHTWFAYEFAVTGVFTSKVESEDFCTLLMLITKFLVVFLRKHESVKRSGVSFS